VEESQDVHRNTLVLRVWAAFIDWVAVGCGLQEGHAVQQQAINTFVQLLRESRGLGLGVILIDQLPGNPADAAVSLPGITIIHSLKDAGERVLVGSQANLTGDQLLHKGVMGCGEAIVHQGFTGQSVYVQVTHFCREATAAGKPWTDQRVRKMMEPFYAGHPHLRIQYLPLTGQWAPDPAVLWNLKFMTESSGFLTAYRERLDVSQESAVNYIRGLVGKYINDPTEVGPYSTLLIEHIEDGLNDCTPFAPLRLLPL
jgi:hypothetical protein